MILHDSVDRSVHTVAGMVHETSFLISSLAIQPPLATVLLADGYGKPTAPVVACEEVVSIGAYEFTTPFGDLALAGHHGPWAGADLPARPKQRPRAADAPRSSPAWHSPTAGAGGPLSSSASKPDGGP